MKNVLVLYDKSHKDFSKVSNELLKNNIQKHFAFNNDFLKPEIIGVRDLFQAMEYFPPFMQKHIFVLPAQIHHYTCELYTYLYDKLSSNKRTTSQSVLDIISSHCKDDNSNQVLILQTHRFDHEYHDLFVKLHLNFLFLDCPELRKYKFKTVVLNKKFEIQEVFEV